MSRSRPVPARRRRGFALLAVLWVLVSGAALAFSMSLAARTAVATARNRMDFARARWQAAGCAERARLVVDETLSAGPLSDAPRPPWRSLDVRVLASPLLASAPCEIAVEPVGKTVNVNALDRETLGAVLVAASIRGPRNDSLVDALLDWRDPDDVPREHGAEREWYDARKRPAPRNGPFADVSEIRLVRGFDNLPPISALVGVEPGRIALSHASPALLAALPGMSAEAVAVLVDIRAKGGDLDNLLLLGARLSGTARELLRRRYVDLTRLTTAEPEGWVVSARTSPTGSRVVADVEMKLVRAGTRSAVVRWRTRWR